MKSCLAAIPFLLVPALLAVRVSILRAGIAGLVATVVAVALLRGTSTPPLDTLIFIGIESLKGLWLALQAVLFIVGGLFFYRALRITQGEIFAARSATSQVAFDRRRLFLACFLLGPFAESATGFGVGMIIALPLIRSAGVSGLSALAFSLFSQILVAWGSLGVGSSIGAELAGVPFPAIQVHGALLMAPILFGHVGVFWFLLAKDGHRPSLTQTVEDAFWIGLLAVALIAATRYAAPDLGALIATGAILPIRALWDDPGVLRRSKTLAATAWPYAALTATLVVTRTVPSVRSALHDLLAVQPFADGPILAPFFHPAFWLFVCGLATLITKGRLSALTGVVRDVRLSGAMSVAVTAIFVVLAQLIASGGVATQFAESAKTILGPAVLALVPLFGALSGFLTGSNSASNGMMMPVQAALARASGTDVIWTAALQNIAGSTFTLLSPTRIASGCALLGLIGQESRVYSRVWPFAVVSVVILAAIWWVVA